MKVLVVINMQEGIRDRITDAALQNILQMVRAYRSVPDARIVFVEKPAPNTGKKSRTPRDHSADTLSEIKEVLLVSTGRTDHIEADAIGSTMLAELMRRDFMDEPVSFDICGYEAETNVTVAALLLRTFVPTCTVTVCKRACISSARGVGSYGSVLRKCGVAVIP